MKARKMVVAGVALTLLMSTAACGQSEMDSEGKGDLHQLLPESIREAGVIVFGGSTQVAPYLYEEAGEVIGLEMDLMIELGALLEVEIELQDTGFDALIPALQSGRIDVAMGDFTDTVERQEVVDFVDYRMSYQGILVGEGNPRNIHGVEDLCGVTIAGVQGSLSLKYAEEQHTDCVDAGNDGIDLLAVQDANAAVLQVQTGRADALLNDYVIATYISQQDSQTELVGEPLVPQFHGAAVQKGNAELQDVLVAAFQEMMDSGTYLEILSEYGIEELAMESPVVNGATE
ncbi:MAG TPA: ABC transporter substrate-binding protein [Candidatus Agrococcus pullicola]|uniref:ABC transporter substrate-binding protein n=1 Tax=Candidatus Agrococcus pullicola TaxID=2838429 RepID=A0A9D1YSR9_9MICO|nr:ABC transporter substrate-binding protein [Candidatus Agrococcus pullicola]